MAIVNLITISKDLLCTGMKGHNGVYSIKCVSKCKTTILPRAIIFFYTWLIGREWGVQETWKDMLDSIEKYFQTSKNREILLAYIEIVPCYPDSSKLLLIKEQRKYFQKFMYVHFKLQQCTFFVSNLIDIWVDADKFWNEPNFEIFEILFD